MTRVALWCRVSTSDGDQTTENQVVALRAEAARRGFEVAREYQVEASAFTGKHRPQLRVALEDARRGEFEVLLVWALDRLSREGPEATLAIMRQFHERGVQVLSQQETWTDGPREMQELLVAIVAWVARAESRRRSERVKAGNERRRAQGLPVGGKPGRKDKKPRKRSGYLQRYGH
jgi:DNA invertase Pin-like site-specific DNA recombinase